MDIKLIAAYEAVAEDLSASDGWEPAAKQATLKVLAQRQMELENWEKFLPLDEVPD